MTTVINSVGLVIDIIGATIIYLNSPAMTYKVYLFNNAEGELMEKKAKRINQRAKFGFILIAFGFVLQLGSNFIK